LWLDEDLGIDFAEEEPQEFLEQHRLIDLDEDGYKEPYIVTLHRESRKVVRIVACFDLEEITVRYMGEVGKVKDFERKQEQAHEQRMMQMGQYEMIAEGHLAQGLHPPPMPPMPSLQIFEPKDAEIVRISPVKYYTKYGFIPAFDGGGYDVGLGQLLGPLGDTINTNLNQMIDAGTLSNLQGGFISRGIKIKKGKARVAPNEWITVDNTSGGSVRDAIVPFAHKGPSTVLLSLVTFLIDAAKDISSVKDAITGESGGANESPTTYLARIDEGLKVFSAIYKRIHRSLKQEYRKLYRLNRLYLPDEDYYTILDTSKAIKREDYTDDVDVIPVSDPSVATTVQKNAKVQAVYQVGKGNPRYNQYEVEKQFLEAMNVPHEGLLLKDEEMPQPPPDPRTEEIGAKIKKMGAETERIQAETAKTYNDIQAKMLELQQQSEKSMMEFRKTIEELDLKRIGQQIDYLSKVVTEQENYNIHRRLENDRGRTANGGGIPSMEGPPNNVQGFLPTGPSQE
jgi:chaperonin GroES